MTIAQVGLSGALTKAPIIEALADPRQACHLHDDFFGFNSAATTGDYVVTTLTGTAARVDAHGGVVRISGTTTDDQGAQFQTVWEVVKPQTGKGIYFETEMTISDVDKWTGFFGLAKLDTTIIATGEPTALATTPMIGFYASTTSIAANAGYLQFIIGDGTGDHDMTATAIQLTDATKFRVGFALDFDGLTLSIYHDDALVQKIALTEANIPSEELAVSFAAYSEGTPGATLTMDIDRYDLIFDR